MKNLNGFFSTYFLTNRRQTLHYGQCSLTINIDLILIFSFSKTCLLYDFI